MNWELSSWSKMERVNLVKMLADSIEKHNALPEEEKRLRQMQIDVDVSKYLSNIFKGNRLAAAEERGERVYFELCCMTTTLKDSSL